MSILSTIAEKIKSSQLVNPDIENQQLDPKNSELPAKKSPLVILKEILKEIKIVSSVVAAGEEKKPEIAEQKNKTNLSTKKDDAVKISKKIASIRKEKDAERIRKEQEAILSPKQTEKEKITTDNVSSAAQKEETVEEGDILGGIVKFIFGGIVAAGGFVVFMRTIFNAMIAQMLGASKEESFLFGFLKTIEEITFPVKIIYKVVSSALGAIGTIIKEGLLNLQLSWNESKLALMDDNFVMNNVRRMLGIEVTDKEREELKKEVLEGRKRKEERMRGYVETAKAAGIYMVPGKRLGEPPEPAPRRVEVPIQAYRKPTPTVTEPAPTPTVAAAPPPPVTRAPAPTPTPAAARAGPPPAPSIKPSEPTLKPAAPAAAQGGVQGLIIQSLKESGITDQKAIANILATVKAESDFRPRSEDLTYRKPEGILATFGARRVGSLEDAKKLVNNPEALANKVYATTDGNSAEGDGWKYRGRGFIQHTGKNQYKGIAKFTGLDVVSDPDQLNDPTVAAKAIPWFFLVYKGLKKEQLSNMAAVNRAIAFADPTGKKAAEREALASSMYQQMGSATMVAQGPTTGQAINTASAEVGSEKARSRQPTVNVTYVDATKVTTATKTVYS